NRGHPQINRTPRRAGTISPDHGAPLSPPGQTFGDDRRPPDLDQPRTRLLGRARSRSRAAGAPDQRARCAHRCRADGGGGSAEPDLGDPTMAVARAKLILPVAKPWGGGPFARRVVEGPATVAPQPLRQ